MAKKQLVRIPNLAQALKMSIDGMLKMMTAEHIEVIRR